MSRTTAPVGEVTTAIRRGSRGIGRLRAGVEEPLGLEPRLELLEGELERSAAHRLDREGLDLELALRRVEVERAAHDDLEAGLEAEGHPLQVRGEDDGRAARRSCP